VAISLCVIGCRYPEKAEDFIVHALIFSKTTNTMKLSLKQKCLAMLGVFLLLLIITNPSAQAFKEYIGFNYGVHRDKNFFIMSVYDYHHIEYVGLVGNFIKEGKDENIVYKQRLDTMQDSLARMADTSTKYDEYGIPIRKK
jgi:hypothetical protein